MNYICDVRDTAPALNVVNVKAADELKAGDVVAINKLVEDDENREVYEATMPAEGDIRYAIIVNQGIEELEDGRRPEWVECLVWVLKKQHTLQSFNM